MKKDISQLKLTNNNLLNALIKTATILITQFSGQTLQIFESLGIAESIGRRIWDRVMDREGPNIGQEHDNGKGIGR